MLKARVKTVGVTEYKFEMESSAGRDSAAEWRIIDVGGTRSQVRLLTSFFFSSVVAHVRFPRLTLLTAPYVPSVAPSLRIRAKK